MTNLEIDISKTFNFIDKDEVFGLQDEVSFVHKALIEGTGKGNDFLGWMKLPSQTDEALISRIEEEALRIKGLADVFIVIGIGGSYLGARAVIEALTHHMGSLLQDRTTPLILYAGHHFGEDYLIDLLDILDNREYALVVISKSGATTEPAIAFRLLKNHLEKKYGKHNARKRIIAITDKSRGALKQLSNEEGYATFTVPDDVGGRYSVLTPVGLLPVAVAGFNIRELLAGARDMEQLTTSSNRLEDNPAALYAATRNALYRKGKTVEMLASYLPSLNYITEWWKQLYGESEGKENKGIFPAGVNLTTDLHSMGQYLQEGLRIFFETVLLVKQTRGVLKVPEDQDNLDGLNFLAGKKIEEVNRMASLGTLLAHVDGGVPNITVQIPFLDERNLGRLIYFFEIACAYSGYLLQVNPFDQPGVEAYKKNMFALLGKPGYEETSAQLRKKL